MDSCNTYVEPPVASSMDLDVTRPHNGHRCGRWTDQVLLEVQRDSCLLHERRDPRLAVHRPAGVRRPVPQRGRRDREQRAGHDAAAGEIQHRHQGRAQQADPALQERPRPLQLVPCRLHRCVLGAVQPLVIRHELEEYMVRQELQAARNPAHVHRWDAFAVRVGSALRHNDARAVCRGGHECVDL